MVINDVEYLTDTGVIRIYADQFNRSAANVVTNDQLMQCVGATVAKPIHVMQHDGGDIADQAAALAYGFAANHCFPDGNKRMAWILMAAFLSMNGYSLDHLTDYARATWIWSHAVRLPDVVVLARLIRTHARPL